MIWTHFNRRFKEIKKVLNYMVSDNQRLDFKISQTQSQFSLQQRLLDPFGPRSFLKSASQPVNGKRPSSSTATSDWPVSVYLSSEESSSAAIDIVPLLWRCGPEPSPPSRESRWEKDRQDFDIPDARAEHKPYDARKYPKPLLQR